MPPSVASSFPSLAITGNRRKPAAPRKSKLSAELLCLSAVLSYTVLEAATSVDLFSQCLLPPFYGTGDLIHFTNLLNVIS